MYPGRLPNRNRPIVRRYLRGPLVSWAPLTGKSGVPPVSNRFCNGSFRVSSHYQSAGTGFTYLSRGLGGFGTPATGRQYHLLQTVSGSKAIRSPRFEASDIAVSTCPKVALPSDSRKPTRSCRAARSNLTRSEICCSPTIVPLRETSPFLATWSRTRPSSSPQSP